jgi:SNF2 family DNA or RNA helicase
MTTQLNDDIAARMQTFAAYLDRSGMDHKNYQEEGVKWCLENELRPDPPANVRGGFIADEMGLGKTIIMIGTFVANPVLKTLIILPPVLVDQWVAQIYRTTGHTPIVFHGKNKKKYNVEHLKKAVIVISTYNTISVTDNQYKAKQFSLLHSVKWNRIVFDEGHHLRNSNTSRLFGARLLRGRIKWLVSGTPIQNKIQDFYNLCQAIGMPPSFYADKDNLSVIARNFILKRTKKQVGIILPEVQNNSCNVVWKSAQEKAISEEIHTVLHMVRNNKSTRNVAISSILGSQPGAILRAILRARQSCILPKMMNKMFDTFVQDGELDSYESYKDGLSFSSKLDSVVDTILANKGNGCGKLVFCHFREEIDEISRRLVDGGIDNIACFDGRVTQTARQTILDAANEVLILQIQTGCEGLNLQKHYSEIYFVSPHWNPCVEDQAVARCHRIGQEKEVKVYRFNMDKFSEERNEEGVLQETTIETRVTKVQDEKRAIANSVITE